VSAPKSHLVRATNALAVGKRVLFVEGKDDEAVYAKWLATIDALYAARLEVIPTNGRNDLDRALPELGNPAEVFALRDRDEWDIARSAAVRAANSGLLVNDNRHCIESYFCDPNEVIPALLAQDAARYGPSDGALRGAFAAPLADWVDHWAMWTVAMQLQSDMVSAGYASFYHDQLPLPPDPDIQARLQSWAGLADDTVVWTSFSTLRAAARVRSISEQHRSCVHGKKFWEKVVLPALRAVENRPDWLIDLADWSPVPPDLDPLLRTALS
jgi:hypothetical protein